MIKRRFYKLERGDRDSGSGSSSFSSGSDLEEGDSAQSNEDAVAEVSEDDSASKHEQEEDSSSTSSGLVNADIEPDDENTDANVDDVADGKDVTAKCRQSLGETKLSLKPRLETQETEYDDSVDGKVPTNNIPVCMIKRKSVFKCRYCPNVICLNEATMQAHIMSKRHTRSERLLKEGKLKTILNGDGEVEELETEEGIHTVDTNAVQENKGKGSKRSRKQRKGSKRKEKELSEHEEDEMTMQQPVKKRGQKAKH